MNYILLAVPIFFLLIGIEYAVSTLILRRRVYRLNDTLNDLSMGIVDQVGGAFLKTLVFAGYIYLWTNWRLVEDMGAKQVWDLGASLWVWAGCFLGQDLMYYWAHRTSHRMNLGWATHIAHHQSEEFNLSVALRQGVFQGLFFWVFYLPLALVGFPPVVFAAVSQVNALYQFWIHTRVIGKLGPLEWVLNTPSHHRVHHGCDVKYVDKNHGGTLIVWDRIFGTFQAEEEEPQYGIVTPLRSWNPLWAQVHYFVKLARTTWRARHWDDRVRLWFKPPEWLPESVPQSPELPETRRPGYAKYDGQAPRPLRVYAAAHFAIILVLAVGFVGAETGMTGWKRALAAILALVTVASLGGFFDARRWALYVEPVRIVALALSLGHYGGGLFGWPSYTGAAANIVTVFLAAISLAIFWSQRAHFLTADAPVNGTETPVDSSSAAGR